MNHPTTGGGLGKHGNRQPLSHEEGTKMKNSKLNNPAMQSSKKWNRPDANWYASSDITDEVTCGEHEVPRPPTKPGGIQGPKLTMILVVSWIVYILCKMMIGAIRKRRIKKSRRGRQ